MKKKYKYFEKALSYMDGVLDGSIPACKWTKLACERQQKDLNKAKRNLKSWDYRFDLDKAERICKFVELMPHIKGEWAGTTIKLEPWQCFYFTTKYGWVHKKTGHRRFRTSYAEIPRKNAKSTVSSAEMLYMATLDGEAGAECYSAATTKNQARIVFDVANAMAKKCPDFLTAFDVRARAHDILVDSNDSKCEPISAEAKNLDGLNIHFASVDELHAHKTRAVYDVIETACGARAQSMLSVITTAGDDIRGICYELHTYLKKILEGVFKDEAFFGIIYTIDEGDEWYSEIAFKKANPNYGVSVKPEVLTSLAQKAKRSASSQNNFKTKHLNVWAKSDHAWCNMEKWRQCSGLIKPRPKLDDLKGQRCWMGFDGSSKLDVSALIMLFEVDGIWLPYGKYYLPHDTVAERASTTYSHYDGWAKNGIFTLTPGDIVDYSYIQDDIREMCDMFDVDSVAYDPWQTTQMANTLHSEGINMVEVNANVKNFSEPMKHLEALIQSRQIDHGDCPVLTWMISNVVAHYDKKDNIYPNKERQEDKIDGVIALIQAIARAILHDDEFTSVYDTRGIVSG
jgi:phage terminase large subunit-like protein